MPVSASPHRASAGAYHNKLHDSLRGHSPKIQGKSQNRPNILNEIRRFGSRINQAINSHEELNRPLCQNRAPRHGYASGGKNQQPMVVTSQKTACYLATP